MCASSCPTPQISPHLLGAPSASCGSLQRQCFPEDAPFFLPVLALLRCSDSSSSPNTGWGFPLFWRSLARWPPLASALSILKCTNIRSFRLFLFIMSGRDELLCVPRCFRSTYCSWVVLLSCCLITSHVPLVHLSSSDSFFVEQQTLLAFRLFSLVVHIGQISVAFSSCSLTRL